MQCFKLGTSVGAALVTRCDCAMADNPAQAKAPVPQELAKLATICLLGGQTGRLPPRRAPDASTVNRCYTLMYAVTRYTVNPRKGPQKRSGDPLEPTRLTRQQQWMWTTQS